MIGLKFLMTFFTAAMYIAVGLFLALLFLFVVSYAIRFFVEGFRWGVNDHWTWFRGYLPRRKSKVVNDDLKLTLVLLDPKDHTIIQLISKSERDFWERRGYIVMDPEEHKP